MPPLRMPTKSPTARLFRSSGWQAKLPVSRPGDPSEQAADRLADHVLRVPDSQEPWRCPCGGGCPKCQSHKTGSGTPRVQPTAVASVPTPSIAPTPAVQEALRSAGQPLAPGIRAFFEPRFGTDLGDVRVHTGERADVAARDVGALAFTVGHDVVFGAGQYQPGTEAGRRLLAHELAHVLQQRDHRGSATDAVIYRQQGGPSAPAFPARGLRVIGSQARALVTILEQCTGMVLVRDSDGLVLRAAGPPHPAWAPTTTGAGRAALERVMAGPGIIIDTAPGGLGVVVGVFSHERPGYQQVDVGNIQRLASATGVGGGLTACDAVLHEIAEASHARRLLAAQPGLSGRERVYVPSHEAGERVEAAIRQEFGLPLKSRTEHGDTQILGQEREGVMVILDSLVFGEGEEARTQLIVLRCRQVHVGPDRSSCANEVVASTVVRGLVRFSSPMEGIHVFNRHAAAMGLRPLQLPAGP
jgi:hypothetical protein